MTYNKDWENGLYDVREQYINGLNELLGWCHELEIKVDKIRFLHHGFQVLFEGMDGDAILHDGSYGNKRNHWETIGMPWDEDDVSTHDAYTLAHMIAAYLDGEDWEWYNK